MTSRTDPNPIATFAVMIGAAMIIAVPSATAHLSAWAQLYGSILVYLAFIEYLGVALALVRWGVGHWRL
ncbi:hypothetical protein OHB26_27480 [Nocardia sp. NBC_01503]|uniref:hypothetical protein n=1 Tax=Nocardia sp. NBC_01503 TaxID=2975997 RepID=UPI002E7BE27C|nr:hypothetical protein [Nocardia sp. NBC_01503]WTL30652.1 hypothetical protein OHB26_27480 [Nocardia sp. NBC_01503]